MFPTGTLSFQVSQQIRSGDDLSVSINTSKQFLRKIGEKYGFSKKSSNQLESPKSPEAIVYEV